MKGGAGHDSYVIRSLADQVEELAGQGYDKITYDPLGPDSASAKQYTLPGNVEEFQYSGSSNLNILAGSGTPDNAKISTGFGNDLIDISPLGKTVQFITLDGGSGNDTYKIDELPYGDHVIIYESDDLSEVDLIQTAGFFTQLPEYIENLELLGSSHISGTGNEYENKLRGNTGNNSLVGLEGNDTLEGLQGADTLVADQEMIFMPMSMPMLH